jgi:hypothetical protein
MEDGIGLVQCDQDGWITAEKVGSDRLDTRLCGLRLAIDADHSFARGVQSTDEGATDEAGGSGHDRGHTSSSL